MASKPATSTYCGVLFCDNPQHEKAIHLVMTKYHHFVIKHFGEEHDDLFDVREEDGEPINTKGKDHWHFVIIFPYSVKREYICKNLGIEENYLQNCSSRVSYLRYLTHFGDMFKTQYTREDFYTNRPIILDSDLKGMKTREELQAELHSIIQNKNWIIDSNDSYDAFIFSIVSGGYWNIYRISPKTYDNLYIVTTGKPIYFFENSNTGLKNCLTGEVIL